MPPAVAEGGRRVEDLNPADRDEVFPGRFDIAQVDSKDVGNPGCFTPAAADTAAITVIEAAEQVPQHSGDDRGAAAPGDEADGLPGHRHASAMVGDAAIHRVEIRQVMDTPQVGRRGGKRERGAGPGEQPGGFKAAQRGPEMLPPSATDEAVEFVRCVGWDLVRVDLASASGHLLRGKPDSEIPQLDEPGTVGPPEQAELLDRQKNKAPARLFRLQFQIWCGGHRASLVCGWTESGCPLAPRGQH